MISSSTMEIAAPERTDNKRGKFEASSIFCLGLFSVLARGSPDIYIYVCLHIKTQNNLLDSTRTFLHDIRIHKRL
jgi:hypothetical protein